MLWGAFWLLSGSGFEANPHNAAHHVFMTLPAYTSNGEDQERLRTNILVDRIVTALNMYTAACGSGLCLPPYF
jgi:hypothetical protein